MRAGAGQSSQDLLWALENGKKMKRKKREKKVFWQAQKEDKT